MNKTMSTHSNSDSNKTFPASVLSVSRDEFGYPEDNPDAQYPPLSLKEKEGKPLPSDLQGHAFIIGATGSVNSYQSDVTSNTVLPSHDGTTPLYNGDGMVYRIDFESLTEGAKLSARQIKAPCYYADIATNQCKKYQGSKEDPKSTDLRFKNLGITRVSGPLGTRNQLNTAFLPLKFSDSEHERLLVTWDVGRPYEIDPKTLETVTPVGKNSEWEEVNKVEKLLFKPTTPFKTIQSSAHPVFDPYTQEMFTVNVGRSLSNVLSQFIPLVYLVKEFIDWIKKPFQKLCCKKVEKHEELLQVSYSPPPPEKTPQQFSLNLLDQLKIAGKSLLQFLRACIGIFTDNFLYLVWWDGSGDLHKWEVLYEDSPLKIKQSTHQMGLTEDYLVLIDTAFKISVEEILPTRPKKRSEQLEKWLRNVFDHPQLKNNTVYIIKRGELDKNNKSVQAKKVTIPREAAHFLVDYRNPDDQITLHLAHVCAWDAAEWLTKFDDAGPVDGSGTSPLYGAIAGPMDISKLGCHVINGKTGQFIRENQDILMDKDYTWGAAIYAYRERPFPDRLEDIYWSCLGCWADLKTPHIEHLYKHYPYREVGLEELDKITTEGKPSTLFRLHIAPLDQVAEDENRLSIADGYQFPKGHWVVSPQFIPRPGTEGSTDGYILCVVHYDEDTERHKTNGNELWIFDAADLKSGPKYKLCHEQFNVGFTIHTAWLPHVKKRNASYCIEMRDDYADILNQQSPKNKALIQDLFENWIYPKKEPETEPKR